MVIGSVGNKLAVILPQSSPDMTRSFSPNYSQQKLPSLSVRGDQVAFECSKSDQYLTFVIFLLHMMSYWTYLNSLAPGWFVRSVKGILFKFMASYVEQWPGNCIQENATCPHWWQVDIGSGYGLVPSGSKPLPEPILTMIYVTIWHH